MSVTGGRSGATGKNASTTDTQKVLDRLDKIEKSLEAKIDASIQSQEFTSKQLTDKIDKFEVANTQVHNKINAVKGENAGIKAQLKVHGTRLLELEDRIKLIERKRGRIFW